MKNEWIDSKQDADVVVIGGGLAGLTAALALGQAGRQVILLEKAAALGGRAASQQKEGYTFNLGPHALYRSGAAFQ
ncbi:MAG: FAD-dependent oxidoreductase, partial [Anaerolineales bacterium]|nr:FAD-dependent oxidoreductase [Anaerolineales bacterium]